MFITQKRTSVLQFVHEQRQVVLVVVLPLVPEVGQRLEQHAHSARRLVLDRGTARRLVRKQIEQLVGAHQLQPAVVAAYHRVCSLHFELLKPKTSRSKNCSLFYPLVTLVASVLYGNKTFKKRANVVLPTTSKFQSFMKIVCLLDL